MDELISVSSRHSTDERQHSVCTYVFNKNGSQWKIKQEHCSSLPDYSIVPGDDALYYFHNPVYYGYRAWGASHALIKATFIPFIIIADDKRILPEHRIKDYEMMTVSLV